ncbi:hypothetical protein SAMN02910293_01053 [Streptococcus henryi]|uniref:Uncharacterized protein n=1 Tax=Streptococcus henryi TaxID=439219 RepID=A0A1G6BJ68_9STRE|nr:hypothetical protein [Streptococcus henryi]SDB20627.1 hypothetical protein SAMN02910293_01053 [Streptococcus henryi]
MKIKDINFGQINGRNESKEPNFSEMFYDGNGHYKELESTRKFLIVGRKGTGKTTLAEYFLTSSKKNQESKMLTSTDFVSNKLKEFYYSSITSEEEVLFWKYIYLCELGNLIISHYERLPFWHFIKKGRGRRMQSFLETNQMMIQELVKEDSETVNSNASMSISGEIGTTLSGTSLSATKTTSRRSKYFEVYDSLFDEVMKVIGSDKVKYTIFYDDMDQLEEYEDNSKFKSLIKSMIYAAEEINLKISDYNNSKICILLRNDVVSLLQKDANNLNKTVRDLGIEIKWFNPNVQSSLIEHPLMQMVLHKIKKSYKEKDISLEEIINQYFPEEKVFSFMMERGFGRPRDIISFLNEYKKYFGNEEVILIENLKRVEPQYSEHLYSELTNEIKMTGRADRMREIFECISRRGYPSFKFSQLQKFMIEQGLDTATLLDDLSLMVDLGILGVVLKNKRLEFTFRDNLEKSVDNQTRFTLHYGLRKYFNV